MNTRVAVVGFSSPHGDGYVDMCAEMTDLFPGGIVLCDWDVNILQDVRQKYFDRVVATYTQPSQALTHPDVEVVIITVNNYQKPKLIIQSAQAGKHIVCEKPCAVNPIAFLPAIKAVEDAGVCFTVMFPWRYHQGVEKIVGLKSEGVLGKIWTGEGYFVSTQVTRLAHEFSEHVNWLFKKRYAGGGVLSWLGIHWIDLFRYLIGEVESVSAAIACHSAKFSHGSIDVEDVATVTLRFTNEAIGTIHTGWTLPSGGKDLFIGLNSESSCVHWMIPDGQMTVRTDIGQQELSIDEVPGRLLPGRPITPFTRTEWIDAFVRDFVKAAFTGQLFPVGINDALRALEIVHAAYRSAAEERVVYV